MIHIVAPTKRVWHFAKPNTINRAQRTCADNSKDCLCNNLRPGCLGQVKHPSGQFSARLSDVTFLFLLERLSEPDRRSLPLRRSTETSISWRRLSSSLRPMGMCRSPFYACFPRAVIAMGNMCMVPGCSPVFPPDDFNTAIDANINYLVHIHNRFSGADRCYSHVMLSDIVPENHLLRKGQLTYCHIQATECRRFDHTPHIPLPVYITNYHTKAPAYSQ